MNKPDSADETRRARIQATLQVMALALLVCGAVQVLVALAVRYLIAGQIGLSGLDTFEPAVETLEKTERLLGPGIAVIVSLSAGSRAWSNLKYRRGQPDLSQVDWVWSFWIPILIGAVIFLMIYNMTFGNAVPGGRDL